jgi:hypothetical protein
MIRRLSPDMYIFVSFSCISKVTRVVAKLRNIRFFKMEGNHPSFISKVPRQGKNCAELLTSGGKLI